MCFLGWKSRDSVPKLVDDYLTNKLPLDLFVSHSLGFEAINEAFHLMHTGERFVTFSLTKIKNESIFPRGKTWIGYNWFSVSFVVDNLNTLMIGIFSCVSEAIGCYLQRFCF